MSACFAILDFFSGFVNVDDFHCDFFVPKARRCERDREGKGEKINKIIVQSIAAIYERKRRPTNVLHREK